MLKNEAEILIPLDENQYEWVELPSRGECYPHKKSKVPVAYMTAMDENIIVSEKLRSQRKVSETLLERKILDKSFNVKDLCIADRDAILIWLRKTSYGSTIHPGGAQPRSCTGRTEQSHDLCCFRHCRPCGSG